MTTTTAPPHSPTADRRDRDALAAALACAERESTLIRAERAAFEAFRTRVSRIDPTPSTTAVRPATQQTALQQRSAADQSALADVERAYRETVMACDHYEREYDDTYAESLTVEFGPELAAALRGAGAFTPLVQDRLLAGVDDAIENRRSVAATLDREADALETGRETLAEIRADLDAVDSRPFLDCTAAERRRLRDDLDALAERCEALVTSRQTGDLHTTATVRRRDDERSLHAFLYGGLDVRFPLLAAAATTSERIERVRRRLAPFLD